MAFCSNCGVNIKEAKFCQDCGSPAKNSSNKTMSDKNMNVPKKSTKKQALGNKIETNIKTQLKYCNISEDKFKNRIDLSAKGNVSLKTYSFSRSMEKGGEIKISARYTKTEKIEAVIIDYNYTGLDWLFIEGRDFIINTDSNKNYKSSAIKSDSNVGKNAAGQLNELLGSSRSSTLSQMTDIEVNEVGYYVFSLEDFDQICKSEKIAFQINSQKRVIESDEVSSKKAHIILRSLHFDLFSSNDFEKYLEENNSVASGSGCFVATATMGNYNNQVVYELRLFRDTWLLEKIWGQKFTNLYYKEGPKAARIIAKSLMLRKISFIMIIKPLHFLIKKIILKN